jgi:hypothetical protein
MITFEPELAELRERGALVPALADRLIAVERRDVFSIDVELRAVLYIAVALLMAGVGILVAKHRNEIGPITLMTGIALAAAAAYAFPVRRKVRHLQPTAADEYLLLLGSLLVSADVGFAEHQFHLLDQHWPRHFLLLAVIHAAVAYAFASRIVLSLAISSLAAWLGAETNFWKLIEPTVALAWRGLLTSVVILVWKVLNRFRGRREFDEVFDHFIAILGLASGVALVFDRDLRWVGVAVTAVYAAASIVQGVRSRREALVIYGVVGGMIAMDGIVAREIIREEALVFLWVFVSSIAAVVLLFAIHFRMRRGE